MSAVTLVPLCRYDNETFTVASIHRRPASVSSPQLTVSDLTRNPAALAGRKPE